jgi:hypothetical protein
MVATVGVVGPRSRFIFVCALAASSFGGCKSTPSESTESRREHALVDRVNTLRGVAADVCAGKAEDVAGATQILDDTLRAEPGLEDIPWARFDDATLAKLRVYDAMRPRLRDFAATRKALEEETRNLASEEDRAGTDADAECQKTIGFVARGRVANFRVVGGSGSRYEIEINGVHGELVTTKTEWSTIGWASLPIVAATNEQIAMLAIPPTGPLFFEVSPDTIEMAHQCQDAVAASAKDKAARLGTKAALDQRAQQLRHAANTLAVEMVAACRGGTPTAATGANDAGSGSAPAQRRVLTALGLPLSVEVRADVVISPRSTGKGPTNHADIDPDGLNVDLIEWTSACAASSLPADSRPVLAEDKDGTSLQYYTHADGSHGGVLCNGRIGFRCSFDGVLKGRGAEALEICRSVERVTAGAPTPSDHVDATASLTVDAVTAVMASQVSSLSATGDEFAKTFDEGAIAWLPDSLALAEGRSDIASSARRAWGAVAEVDASVPVVDVGSEVAWATARWKLTLASGAKLPVRVTEVFTVGSSGPHVVAAVFSVPPPVGAKTVGSPVPAIRSAVRPGDPEVLLTTPVELAKHVADGDATAVVGSDEAEFAIGSEYARTLLTSWKNVKPEYAGNVRVLEEGEVRVVAGYVRWRAKSTLFRVLTIFVPAEVQGIDSSPIAWELATAHFSVVPAQRGP